MTNISRLTLMMCFMVVVNLLTKVTKHLLNEQKDRSSGLPLMQVFCVVDNKAPRFAPLPLPFALVTRKCRLIYCKIILFKKQFLNICPKK